MFKSRTILILAGNAYDALDLSAAIEDRDGCVVGPVATVNEALAILHSNSVAAAVVDCDVTDCGASEVVMFLTTISIPVVIQTSTALPQTLNHLDGFITVLRKPVAPSVVLATLLTEIKKAGSIS